MKFSSSSAMFATLTILASFASIASARFVCPRPITVEKTVNFVSSSTDLEFNFPNLPESDEGYTVEIYAEFSGDINSASEYADVRFGGRSLFTLGHNSPNFMNSTAANGNSLESNNCYKDTATTSLQAAEYNQARSSAINVKIDASRLVGNFCQNDYGIVRITVQPTIPVYEETKYVTFDTHSQTLRFSFSGLPRHADPATPVSISGSFHGDINSCDEYARLSVGGLNLFTLGAKSPNLMLGNGSFNCYTDNASINITAAEYYTRNVKDVDVILDTSSAVNNICPNDHGEITIAVKPDCRRESRTESVQIPSTGGDPHITTWNNEHFEYHGQCDLTLVKNAGFADGLGLDVQIRTKVVRHWSYIKNVAIKIGNDILEIEGSADAHDADAHYWINYEYQGDLPSYVSQEVTSIWKRRFIIDLSPKYPGSSIIIQLYKEFIRVKFLGGEGVFGSSVGLMGDYKTGLLLGRDGSTVMTDFTEFGDEWQVLPSEPKLFHEFTHPQFPELCIKPEDPRGERKRRLAESAISVEQAEAACAPLKDALSIKDCVYDILATQDLGMVGAF